MDELALLTGLLERYSPTDQEAEAVAFLVDAMQAAGLLAHVDEIGNAIGVVGDGPRQIVLLGHIDTVPEQVYADTHFDDDVQRALDALAPEFRAAVVLCDIEGLSYEEIAATLGIKLGTVRSRIHRGRAALRESLAHRAPGAASSPAPVAARVPSPVPTAAPARAATRHGIPRPGRLRPAARQGA